MHLRRFLTLAGGLTALAACGGKANDNADSAVAARAVSDLPPGHVPIAPSGASDLPPGHVPIDPSGAAQLQPLTQALLDSGNAAFRAQDFDAALRHYANARARQPEHAAPWFGTYMVAQATKNSALADSALRMVRQRAPEMQAHPIGPAAGLPPSRPPTLPYPPHQPGPPTQGKPSRGTSP